MKVGQTFSPVLLGKSKTEPPPGVPILRRDGRYCTVLILFVGCSRDLVGSLALPHAPLFPLSYPYSEIEREREREREKN